MYLSASTIYDYLQCPYKVWSDIYGDKDKKEQEINPFVELLWNKGIQHEENVIAKLGEFLDLSEGTLQERAEKTLKAMKIGINLIYQGVLIQDNILGIPDILEKQKDNSYIPIDIKSGKGFENESYTELKKHYALQLCLYSELLNRLDFSHNHQGKIIDKTLNIVDYNLSSAISKSNNETWWEQYLIIKDEILVIINNEINLKPALSGKCKHCLWYNYCKNWIKENNDLTNIFNLGRKARDTINKDLGISKIKDFSSINVEHILTMKDIEKKSGNKKFLFRVGEKVLKNYINRAKIISITKKPIVNNIFELPKTNIELFFDIEDDPTQDYIYLHGIYYVNNSTNEEKYIPFIAQNITEIEEKKAWKEFWDFIRSLDDYSVYYYSSHEKTEYKKLQIKYPDIVSEEEVENFFNSENSIDLYSIIKKYTEWPLSSYGLKEIAIYLGFQWRDTTPSGALSIKWFNEFIDTKDTEILKRILDYNEDDCKATKIIKDFLTNSLLND